MVGDNNLKDQEIILKKYLSFFFNKKSYDELKKEVIEKGYSLELFDKTYNEFKQSRIGKIPSFDFNEINKIQNQPNIDKSQIKQDNQSQYLKKIDDQLLEKKLFSQIKDGKEVVMIPVEKKELERVLKEKSPKNFFVPSSIMTYVFSLILLIASFYSLYNSFSLKNITSPPDSGVEIKSSFFEIGYPLVFISVSAIDENPLKINFFYLLVDFFIYLVVAYIIDISIRAFIFSIKENIKAVNKEEKENLNFNNFPSNPNMKDFRFSKHSF